MSCIHGTDIALYRCGWCDLVATTARNMPLSLSDHIYGAAVAGLLVNGRTPTPTELEHFHRVAKAAEVFRGQAVYGKATEFDLEPWGQ